MPPGVLQSDVHRVLTCDMYYTLAAQKPEHNQCSTPVAIHGSLETRTQPVLNTLGNSWQPRNQNTASAQHTRQFMAAWKREHSQCSTHSAIHGSPENRTQPVLNTLGKSWQPGKQNTASAQHTLQFMAAHKTKHSVTSRSRHAAQQAF
jgi:hypothetical protein